MNCQPLHQASERFLDRNEAAKYVTERGLKLSRNTLQKYATVGGGPVYRRFGKRAVYLPSDLDSWLDSKLSAPRSSSSPICSEVAR